MSLIQVLQIQVFRGYLTIMNAKIEKFLYLRREKSY